MTLRRTLPVLAVLALVTSARAVIEVKDPLTKVVNVMSKTVFSAEITKLDADKNVVELKPQTAYKGEFPADTISLKIKPDGLFDQLKATQTAVIFQGQRSGLVHLADHWYLITPASKPGNYIVEARKTEYDGTFPQTTANLLPALDEIKGGGAGKSTLTDTFPPISLPKPTKLGTFPVPRDAVSFSIESKDGKPQVKFNDETRMPVKDSLAQITTADGTFVLTSHELTRIDNSKNEQDDLTLTGSKLTSFYPSHKNGFTSVRMISIDINQDNRPDLIILTPEGSLTLLNRGFNCYLVNKDIAQPLLQYIENPLPATSMPATAAANPQPALPLLAATPKALYLLTATGCLYQFDLTKK